MAGPDYSRNEILFGLRRNPRFPLIQDRFEVAAVPTRQTVQESDKKMRFVYFPLSGMLSTVAEMSDGSTVEICCVGRNGMVNWETLFGAGRSHFRHFSQIAGEAASIDSKYLMPLVSDPAVARYVSSYSTEVSLTAACNVLHPADERLARWLLIASDKTLSDELPLTQEYIAMMLGSRRSTVSIAAGILQDAGVITYRRGHVRILDRDRLIAAACECYPMMNRG